jgi:hypothetical protein
MFEEQVLPSAVEVEGTHAIDQKSIVFAVGPSND